MKVCLVSPFPPPYGGMAVQATKIEKNLHAEGFEVIRIATNISLPLRIRILERIKLVRTIARSIVLLLEINRQCRKVDVFYFLTGFFSFFFWVTAPVLLLLKLRSKRVILSARGGEAGRFFRKWKTLVKPVLKLAEKITVPSGFLAKDFAEILGIDTVVVPNIADVSQFVYRERREFKPKLIVTRHLEKIYDVGTVIRAFALICGNYPEATLAVAGDGPERPVLERLAERLGLDRKVSFLGVVPHDQLPALYNENDIFINASRVDNLPGTILEAFASGLPVVSTHAGGIPHVVENGRTGFLVELGDYGGLAAKVMAIIEDPATGKRLAEAAFQETKRYSWEYVGPILVNILQRVIEGRSESRRPLVGYEGKRGRVKSLCDAFGKLLKK